MTRRPPMLARIGSLGPTGPKFVIDSSASAGAQAAVSARATSALTAARKREGESFAMTGLLSKHASNQMCCRCSLCCIAASILKTCDDSMLQCEDKRPQAKPEEAI